MAAKKKKKAKKAAKPAKAKKAPAKTSKKSVKKAAAKKAPAKKAKKPAKKTVKAAAKKAPAKKTPIKKKQIVGEGDYAATKKFDTDQASFVKKNKAKIPEMGKAAEAALEGPQGDDLRAAEAAAAGRSRDTFEP
jgi:hypothetical protein